MISESIQQLERLPIVVGVTGHRALPPGDVPALEAAVRGVFLEIQAAAPDSPVLLMTPLAEGSDRLVARVAHGMGIPFVAMLPMEPGRYREDFSGTESLQEFDELLKRACATPIIVEDPARGDGPSHRTRLYRAAGERVVRLSQVLIALWDGKESQSDAGTYAMVRLARFGCGSRTERGPVPAPPDGTWVAHVHARRAGSGTDPAVGNRRWFEPGMPPDPNDDGLTALPNPPPNPILSIDRLNRDLRDRGSHGQGGNPDASEAVLPVTCVSRWQKRVSGLAGHWQKRRAGIFFRLLALGVMGFACLQVYAHVLPAAWPLLLVFLVATAVAALMLRYHQRRNHENRTLEYRTLSEALRVQRALNQAGVPGDVSHLYPVRREEALEWTCAALRTIDLFCNLHPGPAARPGGTPWTGVDFVLKDWIQGQIDYFLKLINTLDRKRRIYHRIAFLCVGTGLAAAAILLVLHLAGVAGGHDLSHGLLVLAAGLPIALGASVEVYAGQKAMSETQRQYRRMLEIFLGFQQGLLRLRTTGNINAVRDDLVLLAREALSEHADWAALHRSRHPKVHLGG